MKREFFLDRFCVPGFLAWARLCVNMKSNNRSTVDTLWATCAICSTLHGWSSEQKNEQPNNAPNPKNTLQLQLY